MNKILTRWRAAIALLAVAGVVAACGGSSASQPSVATLSTARPEVAGTDKPASVDDGGRQAFVDFAECMRKEGIDFPDPQFDANGQVEIRGLVRGGGLDFQSEEFQAAQESCGGLLEGLDLGFDTEQQAELQDTLVEFAGCMRDNGIDMADPQLGSGGGPNQGGGPFADVDQGSPEYQAAFEACGDLLGDLPGPGGAGGS